MRCPLLLAILTIPLAAKAPNEPVFKKNKAGTPDVRFMARHEKYVAGTKKQPDCELPKMG